MAYEQKPLTGALFKNDKDGNDKRPDYRGDCLIDGTTYKIAAWIKESAKGAKFMSLKFEVKDADTTATQSQGSAPRPAPKDDFGDSDIPF
jgi:uncharacterized protein (DUF736 family)